MKGTIVLSFDDGCNDTARLASELEKRRLPATFNIVTGWVDRTVETESLYATVDELKQIYATGLFEIAGHGDSHQNADDDVIKGNDKLREWFKMSEIGFASPGSRMKADYIRENEEKYKAMGITYIRTSSFVTPDPRYDALAKKAKKEGCSDFVLQQLYYGIFNLDSMAVPSVIVANQTPLEGIKELAEFTASEGFCTVFMFHAVRKKDEKNYDSTWSYDFDKFCEFSDLLCELRDSGKAEILTTIDAVKKYRK